MPLPRIGVVIVTMGTRPRELDALLASVEKQDVLAQVVLVGNATPLTDVDANVIKIPLAENLGCPGGRNVGLILQHRMARLAAISRPREMDRKRAGLTAPAFRGQAPERRNGQSIFHQHEQPFIHQETASHQRRCRARL